MSENEDKVTVTAHKARGDKMASLLKWVGDTTTSEEGQAEESPQMGSIRIRHGQKPDPTIRIVGDLVGSGSVGEWKAVEPGSSLMIDIESGSLGGFCGVATGRVSSGVAEFASSGRIALGHGLGADSEKCAQNAVWMPGKGQVFQIKWLAIQDRSYLENFFRCEAADSETVIATMVNVEPGCYRDRTYVFRRGDVAFLKPGAGVYETYLELELQRKNRMDKC